MTSTLERRGAGGNGAHGSIDPRIAARRDAVEAESRRKRSRRWMVVLGVLALLVAAWFVTRTAAFDVDHIVVRGAARTQVDAIVDAAAIRIGEPLLEIDASASASRIRALPWVDTATVTREWGGTITITVTERVPVALVLDESGAGRLIDASGRVLALDSPEDGIDTVVPGAVAGEIGTTVDGLGPALEVAALLSPGMRSRIATITVQADGSVSLGLRPQGTASLGSPTDLGAKVAALRTVMAQVDQRDLASINVMNPSTPVVTRTPRKP